MGDGAHLGHDLFQPVGRQREGVAPRDEDVADGGRAPDVGDGLEELYPDVDCELDRDSPFQLLCATILSAQCTDERVNKVTPALFR
ncbi:MAG TPA: hypothetical protein VIU64_21025, partial [Polyangia bacterium]